MLLGFLGCFFFFFTKGSTQVFFFTNHQYVQGTFICKIVSETPSGFYEQENKLLKIQKLAKRINAQSGQVAFADF